MADIRTGIELVIRAKDEASQVLQGVGNAIEGHAKQFRMAGLAMVAAGGAITAMLGLAAKAAMEEEVGISRLTMAMRNVGLSYKNVSGDLEKWITIQQQKTAISDSAQRDSLSKLILMTGDLGKAQNMLTLAMDVARGTARDLAGATQLIQYAYAGNWGMLERYIPAIKEAATEQEKWALLQRLFTGQAEEYGKTMKGQMEIIGLAIDDLKEKIGGMVVTAIAPYIEKVTNLVKRLTEWADAHPDLLRKIVLVTGAMGGLLVAVGTLLMVLPTLVQGIGAVRIALTALAAHPLIIWLTAATAAITFFYVSWVTNWMGMREAFEVYAEAIVHGLGWVWDRIMWFAQKVTEGLAWVMRQIAQFINIFSREWAMSIWNAAETMTKAVADFRESSVAHLMAYDADFKKATKSTQEEAEKVVEAYGKMGVAAEEAAEKQRKALESVMYSRVQAMVGAVPAFEAAWALPGGTPGRLYTMLYEMGLAGMAGTEAYKQLQAFAEAAGEVGYYEKGGEVKQTGLALVHKGEMVLPARGMPIIENIISIYLDGEPITHNIVKRLTQEVRLQGGLA